MTSSKSSSISSLRDINCEMNHLSMPDGSATLFQGDTCVVVGIYGPIEAKLQKMMYDKASMEVVFAPIEGPNSIKDRVKELYIRDTCESALLTALHPGTAISINVQEITNDGGLLACTINACCLALINSGLPMKYTLAAVNCMIDKDSNEIILDPNERELRRAKSTFSYTFDSIKKHIINCQTTGQFTEKELVDTMNQCREASDYIFEFYRNIVRKYADMIS